MLIIRWGMIFILILSSLGLIGCHHQIAFEDIGYTIASPKQETALLVVIDQNTINQLVPIKSWMTGIAHSWEAKPGQMLKQVADVEFPQMFSSYEWSSAEKEFPSEKGPLTLILTVPQYTFADFHAVVTVRAKAYQKTDQILLEKTYTKDGIRQGGKMFWGGAFAMKSAMRQSSFDAYKKVFTELRSDLLKVLKK
jgi:hypothetical protein